MVDIAVYLGWASHDGFFHIHVGGVVAQVAVTAVFDTGILKQVCHSPVGEKLVGGVWFFGGWIDQVEFFHDLFNSSEAVFVMPDKGFGCVIAEAVEEIDEENVARAVVGTVISNIAAPIVELHVGVVHIFPVKTTGVVIVHVFREHREAFVDPGFFVPILVPVDHMLEFMRHRTVYVIVPQVHGIRVDQEHLVGV